MAAIVGILLGVCIWFALLIIYIDWEKRHFKRSGHEFRGSRKTKN